MQNKMQNNSVRSIFCIFDILQYAKYAEYDVICTLHILHVSVYSAYFSASYIKKTQAWPTYEMSYIQGLNVQ